MRAPIDPHSNSHFSYLSTLPAEYRLYASQASFFRMRCDSCHTLLTVSLTIPLCLQQRLHAVHRSAIYINCGSGDFQRRVFCHWLLSSGLPELPFGRTRDKLCVVRTSLHFQELCLICRQVLAVLVSQIIVSVRTYAISRKSRWVLWTLAALFLASLVPELVGNVYKRIR